jgi:hypothetical protein
MGIELGNYLQGIHMSNLNAVGTVYGLYYKPTAGLNVEFQVADSYLDGKVYLSGATGDLEGFTFHHTYFDTLHMLPNDIGVEVEDVGRIAFTDCTFSGTSTIAGLIGLKITGPGVTPAKVTGSTFNGYSGAGAKALLVDTRTYVITFANNQFSNNAVPAVTDNSSAYVTHQYSNTTIDNKFYSSGAPGNGITMTGGAPGGGATYVNAVGSDPNIQYVFTAAGLPGVDYWFRDGTSGTILSLNDSQSPANSRGLIVNASPTGESPRLQAEPDHNVLIGCKNAQATNATGCMMQIPYMGGTPTGVPASVGGATMVFDVNNNKLCVFSPTAAAWKCTATMN